MKTSPGNSAHPAGTARHGLPRPGVTPGGRPLHHLPPSAARVAPSPLCTGMERAGSAPKGMLRWDGGGASPRRAEAGQGVARGSPGTGGPQAGHPPPLRGAAAGAAPAPCCWPGMTEGHRTPLGPRELTCPAGAGPQRRRKSPARN